MHPSTEAILKHFTYDHLPAYLQMVSRPICTMAWAYAEEFDGPELTAGLRKLLEAKDCLVRAAIESECRCIQSMQGCPVHDKRPTT